MRIGIFGGTFDPPHVAHLILAAEAVEQLALDRLLWVLTPVPPHKPNQVISAEPVRFEMLQAAICDNPAFELSTIDIDRPAPHYAVDTIRLLLKIYPADDLVYLIGEDSLRDMHTWYHPQELVRLVDSFGVMRRPNGEADLAVVEGQLPGIGAKLTFIDSPLLQISSRDIRARAAEGRPYRYFVPKPVYDLIERSQLYRPAAEQAIENKQPPQA